MPINIDGSKGIRQNTTEVTKIPVGTTAQRPANPELGMIRFNTDQGLVEWYDEVYDFWYPTNLIPVAATGGTVADIEQDGELFRVHTFTSDGTFDVARGGGVEYFVVGGGGGGSGDNQRGGGGGGFVASDTRTVTAGAITVIVGQGGDAGPSSGDNVTAMEGGDSSFDNITASGAKLGDDTGTGPRSQRAGEGGSGGGASGNNSDFNEGGFGGQDGSDGLGTQNFPSEPDPHRSRGLGAGLTTRAFGVGELYAGGGGGSGDSNTGGSGDRVGGKGGNGGGGDGAGTNNSFTPTAGVNGKGGGGGAASRGAAGAPGGSGIVIVRYRIG